VEGGRTERERVLRAETNFCFLFFLFVFVLVNPQNLFNFSSFKNRVLHNGELYRLSWWRGRGRRRRRRWRRDEEGRERVGVEFFFSFFFFCFLFTFFFLFVVFPPFSFPPPLPPSQMQSTLVGGAYAARQQGAKATLYVGGLSDGVNEAALHAAFIPFGEIKVRG